MTGKPAAARAAASVVFCPTTRGSLSGRAAAAPGAAARGAGAAVPATAAVTAAAIAHPAVTSSSARTGRAIDRGRLVLLIFSLTPPISAARRLLGDIAAGVADLVEVPAVCGVHITF